jgi:hypothetical protein
MSQNLATYSISQMPHIAGPYLFNMKTLNKLAANSLNQSANPFTEPQLRNIKLSRLAILGWNREHKSLSLKKFLLERLRQISPVCQKQPAITAGQFADHFDVMDICRCKIEGLNHTNRVDFYMEPKTIKSLAAEFFAIAGLAFKKLATSRPGESAYRYWKAVKDHNCIGESFGNVLKQSLLDLPQVGCVTDKADATSEPREVVAVESFEELEDGLFGVQAEAFTYDFHRKYFAIRQLWQRSAFSKGSWWKEFFHKIISFTEDIYDKIIKVHFLPSMVNGTVICFLIPSTRGHFLY